MLSNADSRKKSGEDSGIDKFINDLETVSKALHVDKTLARVASSTTRSRSKSAGKSSLSEPKKKSKNDKNNMKDSFEKDKKPSIWSWKGLKALTNVRNHRFNCCFTLLFHSIEGLPAFFDNVCLVVHWKRRDIEQMTCPVRVYQGVAEFEEQLTNCCTVYGSKSGLHRSAKYEAMHFLLYASVLDAPEVELGTHRIDLTRLLPLTLEELEEEKSSGKWTTSFRLSGKAKGATLYVSFGYVVNGNNSNEQYSNKNVPEMLSLRQNSAVMEKILGQYDQVGEQSIRRVESLPARLSALDQPIEDIKDLHEVLPISRSELCGSVCTNFQRLDEEVSSALDENILHDDPLPSHVDPHNSFTLPDAGLKNSETEWEISEFSVIEKGMEEFTKENVKLEEDPPKFAQASREVLETDGALEILLYKDVALHPLDEEVISQTDEQSASASQPKEEEKYMCSKESLMKELETALSHASDLMNEGLDSQDDESDALPNEISLDINSHDKKFRKEMSFSLDDVIDSVANDFLDMVSVEHGPFLSSPEIEPESPRERLLREFEKDALANGGLLNFDVNNDPTEHASDFPIGSIWETISNDFHHSSMHEGSHSQEMPKIETDACKTKTRALKLEDMETEALMRDWSLNEKAFQCSPPSNPSGSCSPAEIPPDYPHQLPSLAEGLGPFMETKDRGFLCSMNPVLFKNAKSGGSLIVQVSSPVVVPAEMGSSVINILESLAAAGIEKLSMQANKLMPLEDITGKTIQQIAWEAATSLDGPERKGLSLHGYEIIRSLHSDSTFFGNKSEYVCLEDLAPLAMDKIEALSIEGLRIQSGMSNEDAPNISAKSIDKVSAMKGKKLNVGGLQLLDIKDNGEAVDGLMGLSLTLDEWMKLDSGEVDDDDDLINEQTSRILAAHHATSTLYLTRGRRNKGEERQGGGVVRKHGLLGNNFSVAVMAQLHDPLRNYEPVGTPMLAVIQVERMFLPPKTKIYSTVRDPEKNTNEEPEEGGRKEKDIIEINEEEAILQYKITEVHVAGLKTEAGRGKNKLWGSKNQQQSGSRWLLANGMGKKKNKHLLMKSKINVAKNSGARAQAGGDTLWSVSCRVHGAGLAPLNSHIRNPDIVIVPGPNETIR